MVLSLREVRTGDGGQEYILRISFAPCLRNWLAEMFLGMAEMDKIHTITKTINPICFNNGTTDMKILLIKRQTGHLYR
jgi:hypothetical protein